MAATSDVVPNPTLYFVTQSGELWSLDTSDNAQAVGGPDGAKFEGVGSLGVVNDTLYFAGGENQFGSVLWSIDSSGTATQLSYSEVQVTTGFTAFNGSIYFQNDQGQDLWQAPPNGIANPVVEDGSFTTIFNPANLTVFKNSLFLTDGGGNLWKIGSDGTVSNESSSGAFTNVSSMAVLGDPLYFAAYDASDVPGLWKVTQDGTISLVQNFGSAGSAALTDLAVFDNGLYFGAPFDNTGNTQLYKLATDGSIAAVPYQFDNAPLNTGNFFTLSTSSNQAPVAQPDTATTAEGAPVQIAVLANDSDPDGDPLQILGATQAAHGKVALASDGVSFTYTPDAYFTGVDTFSYWISDGQGAASNAAVAITVTPVNQPPVAKDDAAATVANQPVRINVLANDSDPDGDALSVASFTAPANGAVALNTDGSLTYTPANGFVGTDTFSYTVSDGSLTSTANASITVAPANQRPIAQNVSATTAPGSSITVAVLPNVTDPDGDTVSVTGFVQPAHGAVALNTDGSFTYTPSAGFRGQDFFTYTVNDGRGGEDAARVTISVTGVNPNNHPPVASNVAGLAFEHGPATTVTASYTDPDVGDTHTFSVDTTGTKGKVTNNGDGTFTYDPNGAFASLKAGATGSDSFTYTVTDGSFASSTATVSIAITGQNDAPVAVADSYSTNEDTALTVTAPGVLGNDTDVDGDALTAILVAGPSHGSLALNGNGSFTYTPGANYNGSDAFTYKANDGQADSNVATVSLTVNPVNDAPVAVADSYSTNEDTALTVTARRAPRTGAWRSTATAASPTRRARTTTAPTPSPTRPTTGRRTATSRPCR